MRERLRVKLTRVAWTVTWVTLTAAYLVVSRWAS